MYKILSNQNNLHLEDVGNIYIAYGSNPVAAIQEMLTKISDKFQIPASDLVSVLLEGKDNYSANNYHIEGVTD